MKIHAGFPFPAGGGQGITITGDAAEIYGRSCARIRSMDQLAGAAGALIRGEIGELAD